VTVNHEEEEEEEEEECWKVYTVFNSYHNSDS